MSEWERVLDLARSLPDGVTDHPFEEDFETTVLRHGAGGKWFGLLMKVHPKYFGREGDAPLDVLNLKIDPEESFAVRELFDGIRPAYHMNKRHWISVILDGSVPLDMTAMLMEKSYDLTRKKLPRCKAGGRE